MPTTKSKSNHHVASSKKSREKQEPSDSVWESNHFHCVAEWHFDFTSGDFASRLYTWGRYLSKNSETFYASIDNIARFLRRDRKTVIQALKEMVKHGWAEVRHREPGKPVAYRFISHKEWAAAHPDQCIKKDTMPWEGEGDPLGQRLRSISGNFAKFRSGWAQTLRDASGLSDDQIEAEFRVFLERNPQHGEDWKSNFYVRFKAHLICVSADSAHVAENTTDSSNDQSIKRDTYQSIKRDTPSTVKRTPTSPKNGTQVVDVELSKEQAMLGDDTRPAKTAGTAEPNPEQRKAFFKGGGNPLPYDPSPKEKATDSGEPEPTTPREQRLREFYALMEKLGIPFIDTRDIQHLREMFLMEPSFSPRKLLSALVEAARTYGFEISPEIRAAKARLDKLARAKEATCE